MRETFNVYSIVSVPFSGSPQELAATYRGSMVCWGPLVREVRFEPD